MPARLGANRRPVRGAEDIVFGGHDLETIISGSSRR
jgi:hypothetical protein